MNLAIRSYFNFHSAVPSQTALSFLASDLRSLETTFKVEANPDSMKS